MGRGGAFGPVARRAGSWFAGDQVDHLCGEDADVVAQMRAAGAVVHGKTNVPLYLGEWQTFNKIHGRTDNPWDPTRTPGGSSGGSAVALATGMSSLEIGSDIGGSIRWPAAYTAIAGLKPSYGLVSQRGHTYPGQDGIVDNNTVGPMARTVADLELALPIMWEPFMAPLPPRHYTSNTARPRAADRCSSWPR